MATLYLNEKNRHIILYELQNIILEKLKTKEFNDLIDFFKNKIVEYYNKHFLKDMKVLEKYKLTDEFNIIKLTKINYKTETVYYIDVCDKKFITNYNYDMTKIYIKLDKYIKKPTTSKSIESEINKYLKNNFLNEYKKIFDLYHNIFNKTKKILHSFSEIINNYRTWNQLTKNHPEFNIIDINKLFPDSNIPKKKKDNKLEEATKNIKEFNKLLKEK